MATKKYLDQQGLETLIQGKFKESKNMAINYIMKLDALSPLKTLSRGYTVLEDKNGDVVTTSKDLKDGDVVKIILHDGTKNAEVI